MFRWLTISLLTFSISTWANDSKVEKVAQDLGISLEEMDKVLILGETEWFYIEEVNHNFKARIDTGATTSSISAIDIRSYKKGKKRFVDFKIAHDDWESQLLTRPVERRVGIVQSSSDEADSRYVVKLDIQIGKHKESTEFTLVDRSQLNYPMLIGRSFIEDKAIVDVAHKYIQPKRALKKVEETKETAKTDKKSDEKSDNKSSEKSDEKSSKKSDDKSSEKSDDKSSKKSDDKSSEKSDDKSSKKSDDKSSKKSDDKPDEKSDDVKTGSKENKEQASNIKPPRQINIASNVKFF